MVRKGSALIEVLVAIGMGSMGFMGVYVLGPVMPAPAPFAVPVQWGNAPTCDPADEYHGMRYVYYPHDCYEDTDMNPVTPDVLTVPAGSWSAVTHP